MKKLLIVEDEVISALALKFEFERLGFQVCKPVASGAKALLAADSEKPDIVLMDIRLRGTMSGIQAAKEIKTIYGIPTILMTGYSKDVLEEMLDGSETYDLVHKPVNLEQLRETIRNVLRESA